MVLEDYCSNGYSYVIYIYGGLFAGVVSLWEVGMKEKINKFLCRRFGHVIDPIDIAVYILEMNAMGAPYLNPELECQRCKKLLGDKRGHCLVAGWKERGRGET